MPPLALREGRSVLVWYDGDVCWHERVLLRLYRGTQWAVVTPDEDVFIEDLDPQGGDISHIRGLNPLRRVPEGIDGNNVYMVYMEGQPGDFYTPEQLAGFNREVDALPEFRTPAAGAGLPIAEGDAGATGRPPGPSGLASDPSSIDVWRAMEARGSVSVGDVVEPLWCKGDRGVAQVGVEVVACSRVGPAVSQGDFAAMLRAQYGTESAGDARVLTIEKVEGRRHRDCKEAMRACSKEEFDDFHEVVPGPRSAAWCCSFLEKRHNPLDHHLFFKTTAKLQNEQWGVAHHEFCMRLLQVALEYDQLDVKNLACMELVLREAQTIEWSHMEKIRDDKAMGGLLPEERAAFAGISKSGGVLMVCPELLEHVRSSVEADAKILKNIRVAREEREHRRKKGNG